MMNKKISLLHTGTVNETFYELFKAKAAELTVKVLRTHANQAATLIIQQAKELGIKKIAAAPLTLVDMKELKENALSAGLEFSAGLNRQDIQQAGMGISEFDLGIAELGSLVQDASSLHSRLVSMLPPVHLAILPTAALVRSFADALEVIEETYKGQVPPYLSFITGPSKTADIERQLTIGVHGPETLIILFIDVDNNRAS